MTPDGLADANRRLNQVSSFDRESNKMLGFQVVARLAARHDIKVMLTTTPGGTGVTAIVRLPRSILEHGGARYAGSPIVDVPAATASPHRAVARRVAGRRPRVVRSLQPVGRLRGRLSAPGRR